MEWEKLPINEEMSPSKMADILFPDSVSYDTEGRIFNRCAAVVAREARKTKGVIEPESRVFIRIY